MKSWFLPSKIRKNSSVNEIFRIPLNEKNFEVKRYKFGKVPEIR
jgi:hypothetical protein